MDLNSFMQSYADEIGGSYSEYDSKTSIIIVPLPDERYQTVLGTVKFNERYQRHLIEFSSKVCKYSTDIDLKELMMENTNLNHAKFAISEDHIQVEDSCFVETATEGLVKEIIQEVANVADEYEFKLTGVDVH